VLLALYSCVALIRFADDEVLFVLDVAVAVCALIAAAPMNRQAPNAKAVRRSFVAMSLTPN
jgi:hypothetical protein